MLQRYDENPDGAILKTECFAVGICPVSNETRLARSRYLLDVLHLRSIARLCIRLAKLLLYPAIPAIFSPNIQI